MSKKLSLEQRIDRIDRTINKKLIAENKKKTNEMAPIISKAIQLIIKNLPLIIKALPELTKMLDKDKDSKKIELLNQLGEISKKVYDIFKNNK